MSKTLGILGALLAGSSLIAESMVVENQWYKDGQAALEAKIAEQINTGKAKNVIVLIADGNGVGTNYATRLYVGQKKGGYGDEYVLPQEAFPTTGLVKTYNVNGQTPDSAGTATAIMSGVKTDVGVIGVNENVNRGDCATIEGNTVPTLNEIMSEAGKSTGVVSTARISHATPSTAYAHSVDRDYEASVPEGCTQQTDITTQLVEAMKAGVIDVALGGGRRNFIGEDITDEEGQTGKRAAGDNLIEVLKGEGVAYAWDQATFDGLPKDGTPLLGLFESSHMQYEADRKDEPSLAEMTKAAIESMAGNENGFFLQVEAGRVDHGNHDGNAARAVQDGLAFADAVAMADELTNDEDTLIIVTADHEHAIAFNGYCGRGSDILGLCTGIDAEGVKTNGVPELAADGKPYTTIGYLNGPGSYLTEENGYTGARPELTQEEATNVDFKQQSGIPKSDESHSGEDVAVYAKGPWSHLLNGTVEQNYLFHVMNYAATAE